VYTVVSGDMGGMIPMDAGKVGIQWLSYFQAETGPTVNVSVSGGKITVTGTNIKTSKLTASYDDYLTFKIVGQ